MLFVELILKNLRHRPLRTMLTVCGLSVAVMAMATLWSVAWGYANSAKDFYSARGVDIVVVRAGVSNRLTSSLRVELAERLRTIAGVAKVDGSLTDMVSLADANLLGIPLRGLTPDGFTMRQLSLAEGRELAKSERGIVLLGRGISDALNKHSGATVRVEDKVFCVAGVIAADNPFDSNSVVAVLTDVQELMGRPGIVSEFQIQVAAAIRNEDGLRTVCRAIESLTAAGQPLGLKAQPTHQFVDGATEAKLGSSLAWAVSAIVVALSLVGMLNTMLMSVSERTREFGVLRAIGWKPARMVRMIIGESMVIGVAGALLGGFAAWTLGRLLSNWGRTSLLVPERLTISALWPAIAGAVLAAVIGSLYPAMRAAGVPPVESLRHE